MKLIEKYIQFAIDNGLEIKIYGYTISNIELIATDKRNYLEIITSKEFIEAISRGLQKSGYSIGQLSGFNIIISSGKNISDIIDYITNKQAIAIRDNELKNFITNLGILGNAI